MPLSHRPLTRNLVFGCLAVALISGSVYSQTTARPQRPTSAPVYLAAPAGKEYARVVPNGTTILPNGRFLTPRGARLYTGDDLWSVMVNPDGKSVVGFSGNNLIIYPTAGLSLTDPRVNIPYALNIKGLAPAGVFTKSGDRLVVSTGDEGGIAVYKTEGWGVAPDTVAREGKRFVPRVQEPEFVISANAGEFTETYVNDLVLSPDNRFAYGVDVAHGRVVTFDLTERKLIASVPAGRQPYALALSSNGANLYVANIGIFNYSLVPPPATENGPRQTRRGLAVPAFGFPSKEAEEGVEREGRRVPGLGSPYVPDAQSVWMYDVRNPAAPTVRARAKAGLLIHAPADAGKSVGGSAPNKLLLKNNRLFVSNANNDTVQIFDAATLKPISTIKLTPSTLVSGLRGVIPSGMAINRAGTRLYVAESGLNAIAVIDVAAALSKPAPSKVYGALAPGSAVLGHIPTGWFPVQIELSPDESALFVATQKGIGRGPQGPLQPRAATDERFGLSAMPGMIHRIDLAASMPAIASLSAAVRINNGIVNQGPKGRALPPSPLPRFHGKASEQIKYVVFITKENHTFDGIFGGIKGAKGQPEYAEFGREGWIQEKGKAERVPIMPNHIKLAEEFAISDNFYMEPQASGDGHRWLVGVYPSLWTTRVFYAGWDYKLSTTAPGRLLSFGSNGSQIPEDYLENGSIWEHLHRGGITFRNYGEGYELPHNDEGPMQNRSGAYTRVNYPMPKVLFDNTDFNFPAYNNNIPDIARADWFIEDIAKYRQGHNGKMPRFLNIAICNDHGARANPKTGYPYTASYMADNDLALGRIVEFLSKQPEWKQMAIFVTQDDSGGDNDHVDRHRSFVLCISPYAKRGYVSKDHTSIMSIIKSVYLTFGLGANNMFDALATDLSDMFTMTPNFAPYKSVPSDRRVFREEETFDPTDPKFERRRLMRPMVRMDDPEFVESLRNRKPVKGEDEDDAPKAR